MGPPEGKHSQKAVPGRSPIPAVDRPHSNLSTRRTHQGKALEKPGSSGKVQEPHNASEPPKVLNGKSVHPTTKSTESQESSNVERRATTAKYTPTSKESGALPPVRDVPTRQGRSRSVDFLQDHLTQGDIYKIEIETRGQRDNQEWHYWRMKKKAVTAYESLASINKGREVTVEACGLFIHPTKNWLAASPDGIVKDKRTGETLNVLEVKCPYKHREHTIREACKDRNFCLTLNGDSYALKRQHAYFTQVQCQMAVSGINDADFVVYTKMETAVVPVKFDLHFWKDTEPKLERFYTEAVLPNIKQGDTRKEDKDYRSLCLLVQLCSQFGLADFLRGLIQTFMLHKKSRSQTWHKTKVISNGNFLALRNTKGLSAVYPPDFCTTQLMVPTPFIRQETYLLNLTGHTCEVKTISSDYLLKLIKRMPRVCKAVIKAKGVYFEEPRI
ncbi:unnamed protein product [Ranitomeya imitator]|uniref:YqaJ viral recombinase domain-containing protein n=1 Tax=Ranitomeya imitator TaxID=111125 RepID=A0ABN9LLR7_9NEOB|nr:unnamed protein product [Ranitomeya imitator]